MIDRGCGNECFTTLLLSMFLYVPGIIYAFTVILQEKPPIVMPSNSALVNTYVNSSASPTKTTRAFESAPHPAPLPPSSSAGDAAPAYELVDVTEKA
uniref:Protein SNA3 n=1 Tax=Angiostrongylus cantonensis TaxID=6313 RepID=A0A0K0D8U3_ANGCA